jgi:hypothetical protein
MTKKTKVLRELTIYFMEKGKIMNNREYKAQTDAPVKSSNVIRILGSWGKVDRMIAKNFPVEYDIITSPVKEEPKKKEPVKVTPKQEPKQPAKPVFKGSKNED